MEDLRYFTVTGGTTGECDKLRRHVEDSLRLEYRVDNAFEELPAEKTLEFEITKTKKFVTMMRTIIRVCRMLFGCALAIADQIDDGKFRNRVVIKSEDIFKGADKVLDAINAVIE